MVILSNFMALYFGDETRMSMLPGMFITRTKVNHNIHTYFSASLNSVDVPFWVIFCMVLGLVVGLSAVEFMFSDAVILLHIMRPHVCIYIFVTG